MKFHGNPPPLLPLSIYIYNTTTLNPSKSHHTSAVANQMEHRRRPKDPMGGRSKPDVVCRKHPKHRQSPGVCSICLSERLSQLSTSSRSASTAMASSSSSSSLSSCSSHYSSSEASSCSSPMQQRFRLASDVKGSFSFLLSGKNMLTKSRSVAFVTRRRAGDGGHANKKSGFWSKLLPPRAKRTEEVLMYSRTVRERVGVAATRIQ